MNTVRTLIMDILGILIILCLLLSFLDKRYELGKKLKQKEKEKEMEKKEDKNDPT